MLLAALVGGVPWALWHFVGWPLPHHVPSATQVGRALNRQGIPAQTLIDALAVVVWLTWAALVVSLAIEVPAALSGRHPPHLPIAGIFQPVTGRLVATVIVACLALAPRPGHTSQPGTTSSGLAHRGPAARRRACRGRRRLHLLGRPEPARRGVADQRSARPRHGLGVGCRNSARAHGLRGPTG